MFLKIFTSKQMFERLPKAFAQVKVGNTSENLLNEIQKIMSYLHQAKEISENICNNIVNSTKLYNRTNFIFLISDEKLKK